jgi:hypothetical protein
MKGDFSRQTFDSRRHYSGVLMQQGRVQVDADWNEQEAIQRWRVQLEARDVIGRCGGPRDDAGFEIAIDGSKLTIGRGRYYVDGLLVENDTPDLPYDDQPDRPGAAGWAADLGDAGQGLVYLDVWERHLTSLDDGRIREVALGGPDTATRIKTVWQVRVLPLFGADPDAEKELVASRAAILAKLKDLGPQAKPKVIAELKAKIAEIESRIAELGQAIASCDDVPQAWTDLVDEPDGTLDARAVPRSDTAGPCVVPPTAGYRRLENQLYRVEVHRPGDRDTATFKWSRDNGTVIAGILGIDEANVTVDTLGPDDVLGFGPGQWVELTDDRTELDGTPGLLAEIAHVSESPYLITLTASLGPSGGGLDLALHPKVRRWDQTIAATADGLAMTADWMPLEDGVEVKFGEGSYRTGDHWVVPARTATGDVEWPPFEDPDATSTAQPRRGIRHHFCRLALLTRQGVAGDGQDVWQVEGCRTLFPPLTDLPTDGRSHDAIHVEKVLTGDEQGVDNDAAITLAQLMRGFIVSCDSDVEPGTIVDGQERPRPTCLVTLDVPFPAVFTDQFGAGGIVGTVPLTLASRTSVSGSTISWQPDEPATTWLDKQAPAMVKGGRVLTHLRLKGNFIYGAGRPNVNLDGEVFGRLSDGGRLGAVLRSGDGIRGGDLEMWFWLSSDGEPPPPPPPPTVRIMLALATETKTVHSDEVRGALAKLLFFVTDRAELTGVLDPAFGVDLGMKPDIDTARAAAAELKIDPALRLNVVVEERLAGVVEVINHDLEGAKIPLTLRVSLVVPELDTSPEAIKTAQPRADLVIGSEESVRKLADATGALLSLKESFDF